MDLGAVLTFAQTARVLGVTRFIVVSSVGADTRSKKFYLRTKGEMEEAVAAAGFPSVDILQPSLLLGNRKQMRPVELLGTVLAPVVNPFLTGAREIYRAIPADVVARGMLGASRRGTRGVYRYTHAGIRQLAELRPAQSIAVQDARKKTT